LSLPGDIGHRPRSRALRTAFLVSCGGGRIVPRRGDSCFGAGAGCREAWRRGHRPPWGAGAHCGFAQRSRGRRVRDSSSGGLRRGRVAPGVQPLIHSEPMRHRGLNGGQPRPDAGTGAASTSALRMAPSAHRISSAIGLRRCPSGLVLGWLPARPGSP